MRKLCFMVAVFAGCSSPKPAPNGAAPTPEPAKSEPATTEPATTEPALARTQAIEEARKAGIIGESKDGRYGMVGDGSDGDAATTKATMGEGVTSGSDLDKSLIRRYVRRNLAQISACYEKELAAKPKLAGAVTVNFEIKPDGTVDKASGTGMPPVDACVAGVIRGIVFPKPKGAGAVQVSYPFEFHP